MGKVSLGTLHWPDRWSEGGWGVVWLRLPSRITWTWHSYIFPYTHRTTSPTSTTSRDPSIGDNAVTINQKNQTTPNLKIPHTSRPLFQVSQHPLTDRRDSSVALIPNVSGIAIW